MLSQSRHYSFLHSSKLYSLHLIQGEEVLDNIASLQNFDPLKRKFYQSSVLSSLQLMNFLKYGERLGFYFDSKHPYFMFKIEISSNGAFRTLMLPKDETNIPTHLEGQSRLIKTQIDQGMPYTSIHEVQGQRIEDVINDLLEKSYQTSSRVLLSESFSYSLLIRSLPLPEKTLPQEIPSLEDLKRQYAPLLEDDLSDIEKIVDLFEAEDLTYLGSQPIEYHCPCSEDRMKGNLITLSSQDLDEVYGEGDAIDIECDYCNKIYTIKRESLF